MCCRSQSYLLLNKLHTAPRLLLSTILVSYCLPSKLEREHTQAVTPLPLNYFSLKRAIASRTRPMPTPPIAKSSTTCFSLTATLTTTIIVEFKTTMTTIQIKMKRMTRKMMMATTRYLVETAISSLPNKQPSSRLRDLKTSTRIHSTPNPSINFTNSVRRPARLWGSSLPSTRSAVFLLTRNLLQKVIIIPKMINS